MKKNIFFTLLLLHLIAASTCKDDSEDSEDSDGSQTGSSSGSGEAILFADISKSLLQPTCVSCHGSASADGGVRLDSYKRAMKVVKPGDPKGSRLVQAIRSGRMPPSGVPVDEAVVAQLEGWITQGARNTLEDKPPPPPDDGSTSTGNTDTGQTAVKFSDLMNQVILPRCAEGCHSGDEPSDNLPLTTFDELRRDESVVKPGSPDESTLYMSVKSGSMPRDGSILEPAKVSMIRRWIEQGANNQ